VPHRTRAILSRPELASRIVWFDACVILSCPALDFLEARIALDLEAIDAHLAMIPRICRGGPEAGEIGALPPRSTVIQMSPVHTGRTDDPQREMERLLDTMVR
jgi:hypothetical protein